ncbi:MAG TPA: molybdopterin molybdenumtransferase MoeA, partial [Syntrophomonas sp.]|nr:molybdopterin molybdenumtransferase MoeA [Syntrophomonas sp.]
SRRFIRGHAGWDEEGWKVTVLPGQKPSMIRSLVNCNALIDMPAGSPPIEVGQDVSILLLNSLF